MQSFFSSTESESDNRTGTEYLNGFIFLSIMITAEAAGGRDNERRAAFIEASYSLQRRWCRREPAGGSDIGKPTVKPSAARELCITHSIWKARRQAKSSWPAGLLLF